MILSKYVEFFLYLLVLKCPITPLQSVKHLQKYTGSAWITESCHKMIREGTQSAYTITH